MRRRRIFVFGSNTEGRHGKGAALVALQEHGARYGQAHGLQGNSYGIVTKELRMTHPAVTLDQITEHIRLFLLFAKAHVHWDFDLMEIGCGLAGFTPEQIAPLFHNPPANIHLPERFRRVLEKKHDYRQ